jgi:hypothetical protein
VSSELKVWLYDIPSKGLPGRWLDLDPPKPKRRRVKLPERPVVASTRTPAPSTTRTPAPGTRKTAPRSQRRDANLMPHQCADGSTRMVLTLGGRGRCRCGSVVHVPRRWLPDGSLIASIGNGRSVLIPAPPQRPRRRVVFADGTVIGDADPTGGASVAAITPFGVVR